MEGSRAGTYSAKGPGGVRWSETLPIYFTFDNANSSVIIKDM